MSGHACARGVVKSAGIAGGRGTSSGGLRKPRRKLNTEVMENTELTVSAASSGLDPSRLTRNRRPAEKSQDTRHTKKDSRIIHVRKKFLKHNPPNFTNLSQTL